MQRFPTGRIRPVLLIVVVVGTAVLALKAFASGYPVYQALVRDVVMIVVALGVVALIRALLPRREQRRHGERRHVKERRRRRGRMKRGVGGRD